jgi:hypothetical protein
MTDSEREPGELAEWGRLEFRWLIRKTGYTLAQRGAWVSIFAAVGLERRQGRISRETAVGVVGARMVDFLIAKGDLEEDGRDLRMHGWESAQAPLERTRSLAAERQRRRRERLRDGNVTERDESVTLSVSVSNVTDSGNGKRAETTIELPPAGAREADPEAVWRLSSVVEDFTGRPWAYGPGNRTFETLRLDIRDFGEHAVFRALDDVHRSGPVPDAAKLIRAAHDLLVPFVDTKPIAAEAERKRQEAEQAERDRQARARAEAETARQRALLEAPRSEAPAEWAALRETLPQIGARNGNGNGRMRGDGSGVAPGSSGSLADRTRRSETSTPAAGPADLPPDRPLSETGPSKPSGRQGGRAA